jgi:predicted flap endonuclease-1-like 5' DNA nuclease
MDAADEAGGETIFSSDGMDPLPIPTVPVREENVYEVLETDAAPLVSTTPSRESPQERLQRLTKEVTALQQELKDNEQVSKLARELSSRLEVSSSISALERSIHQRGSEQTIREDTTSSVVPPESTGNNVEERLVQLERLVGASTCTTSASILARIEKVENLANRIDEKALDEAATRAKVIRADLEAASKARTKLSSAAVSANDAKTISELHTQLKQLEGIGHFLPSLSGRLQQLATLHSQSATFANRLSGVEQELPKLQATLQQLQKSLASVEEGMLANLKTVENNMTLLESKMNK